MGKYNPDEVNVNHGLAKMHEIAEQLSEDEIAQLAEKAKMEAKRTREQRKRKEN